MDHVTITKSGKAKYPHSCHTFERLFQYRTFNQTAFAHATGKKVETKWSILHVCMKAENASQVPIRDHVYNIDGKGE